jgi:hypothetical protein
VQVFKSSKSWKEALFKGVKSLKPVQLTTWCTHVKTPDIATATKTAAMEHTETRSQFHLFVSSNPDKELARHIPSVKERVRKARHSRATVLPVKNAFSPSLNQRKALRPLPSSGRHQKGEIVST